MSAISADASAVDETAGAVLRELGDIDVWVNCAMATVFARVGDITAEEFERATMVTYLGCVHGTMTALRAMRRGGTGVIIQVGSALSYRAIPFQSPYFGAKFAMCGFTDSVRTELLHDRESIRITMVQLPALNTPQFTWGRTRLPEQPQRVPPIFNPEVAAAAIVRAASTYRREWIVGGSSAAAIAGSRLLPARLLDCYLAATGLKGQQVKGRPVATCRLDNLFTPVVDGASVRGIFTGRSHDPQPVHVVVHASPVGRVRSAGGTGCRYQCGRARSRSARSVTEWLPDTRRYRGVTMGR